MKNKAKKIDILLGLMLLFGVGEARAGGKVITLADNLTIPGNAGVDLDAVNVSMYGAVSFLAFYAVSSAVTGTPQAYIAFATESGKYSDSIPKLQSALCNLHPGATGAQCFPTNASEGDGVFRVAGPFLVVHLRNGDSAPHTFTLKVYLTK